MSLINQALKKAQQERQPNAAPQPQPVPERKPGELRPTHAETNVGYRGLQFLVGGAILLCGIVGAVALTMVLMQPKPQPIVEEPSEQGVPISLPRPEVVSEAPAPKAPTVTNIATQVAPEEPPVETVAVQEPVSEPVPPPAPDPVVAPVEPVAPATSAEPVVVAPKETRAEPPAEPAEPIVEAPAPVEVATNEHPAEPVPAVEPTPEPIKPAAVPTPPAQPVTVGAEAPAPPPPPPDNPLPGAEPNPKVLAFLESSRITGIKVAGVHSRLLMNNQIYRSQDIVHPETNLRITEILANEIVFTDESGIQYRKQFRR